MPASFILTIDLTPPEITWGPVDGAVASEELTVLYSITEPGVVSAELQLSDGRILTMTVLADRLTVQLPDDAADGWGTITALLSDDVGNTATASLPVQISGELAPTPPIPEGLPHPPEEPIHRWRSRAIVRSRYFVIRRRFPARVRLRGAVHYTVTRDRRRTLVRLDGRSVTRVRGTVHSASSVSPTGAWTVVQKRPEGPQAEGELLILGIL